MDANYNSMLSHYRNLLEECERKNPFPEQTDEEKIAVQEGLVALYKEMKPSRLRANNMLLEPGSE